MANVLKSLMLGKVAGPLIRHGATALGGFLIAQGWADDATAQEITGGLVAAGGVLVSFVEKEIRF